MQPRVLGTSKPVVSVELLMNATYLFCLAEVYQHNGIDTATLQCIGLRQLQL